MISADFNMKRTEVSVTFPCGDIQATGERSRVGLQIYKLSNKCQLLK